MRTGAYNRPREIYAAADAALISWPAPFLASPARCARAGATARNGDSTSFAATIIVIICNSLAAPVEVRRAPLRSAGVCVEIITDCCSAGDHHRLKDIPILHREVLANALVYHRWSGLEV